MVVEVVVVVVIVVVVAAIVVVIFSGAKLNSIIRIIVSGDKNYILLTTHSSVAITSA